ncbi:unnamed protein product [Heterobilharzia americana]|nr:unnamed protein product [Heterobilharzia americana]
MQTSRSDSSHTRCSPPQESCSSDCQVPEDEVTVNTLHKESHPTTTSPMTHFSSSSTVDPSLNLLNPIAVPYSLNLNWVSPIITALTLSAGSSILNLTTELSSSQPQPSCIPQIDTKIRASSCFPLGRSNTVSLLSSPFPASIHQPHHLTEMQINTNINNDCIVTADDDEKPLDLTLKSVISKSSARSSEFIKTKQDSENQKTSSRRKSNKKPSQVKITTKSGTSCSPEQDINITEPKGQRLEPVHHSNSDITSKIDKNGTELYQQWKLDIPDLLKVNESNQKRQKSSINRRPFKAFGNTIPSISTELLLKSSQLIDPILLGNSVDDTTKTIEHIEQRNIKLTSSSPTSTSTDVITTTSDTIITTSSITSTIAKNEERSRRKLVNKRKTRRSQSTSAVIIPLIENEKIQETSENLSTTKSLECLNKIDSSKDVLTSSITSISSSYPELIHIKTVPIITDCNPRMRRFPEMTPKEVKDKAYWEKRVKNNEAARRSRRARKSKELCLKKYADNLEKVNIKLIEEIELLKAEIIHLKGEKYTEKLN